MGAAARAAFLGDAQQVGVKFAIHVFIVNDGKRIRSRREVFKIAARLLVPNFYHHDIGCRAQIFGRETLWRFEQRARDAACAVSYAQNFHVDSGAR